MQNKHCGIFYLHCAVDVKKNIFMVKTKEKLNLDSFCGFSIHKMNLGKDSQGKDSQSLKAQCVTFRWIYWQKME